MQPCIAQVIKRKVDDDQKPKFLACGNSTKPLKTPVGICCTLAKGISSMDLKGCLEVLVSGRR